MSDLAAAREELRERQGAGARYDAAMAPSDMLLLARRGVSYLTRIVNGLDDQDLWSASGRDGWTRRRVIAAAALQAREIAQALDHATGQAGDLADTGESALDLAETLPARALRHLLAHAAIHLDVTWRDLSDDDWDASVVLSAGRMTARDTVRLQADTLWRAAMDLRVGGRPRDVPADFAPGLSKRNHPGN